MCIHVEFKVNSRTKDLNDTHGKVTGCSVEADWKVSGSSVGAH